MIRRKGIGKDCCGDPCGNKIRKINGISPDPNGEFSIEAGTGISVTGDENGVIIDASRAVGILTVNDEPPDADGNIKISGGSHVDVSESDSEIVIDTTDVVEGSGNIGSDVKPIKIVNGQAVAVANELVDVSSAQTITGKKTHTGQLELSTSIQNPFAITNPSLIDRLTNPSSNITEYIAKLGTHNNLSSGYAQIGASINSDGTRLLSIGIINKSGSWSAIDMHNDVDAQNNQTKYVTAPSRAYNANNTSDIVTIGSLQQSSDVVHRTGNEIITGRKRLSNASMNDRNVKPTTLQMIDLDVGNNTIGDTGCSFKIRFQQNTNGSREVHIGIWDNSISDYRFTNIATQTWS